MNDMQQNLALISVRQSWASSLTSLPSGRGSEKGSIPGNGALLKQINYILGYDFTPFLADLWYDDFPASRKHRLDYYRAINVCLEEILTDHLETGVAGTVYP